MHSTCNITSNTYIFGWLPKYIIWKIIGLGISVVKKIKIVAMTLCLFSIYIFPYKTFSLFVFSSASSGECITRRLDWTSVPTFSRCNWWLVWLKQKNQTLNYIFFNCYYMEERLKFLKTRLKIDTYGLKTKKKLISPMFLSLQIHNHPSYRFLQSPMKRLQTIRT